MSEMPPNVFGTTPFEKKMSENEDSLVLTAKKIRHQKCKSVQTGLRIEKTKGFFQENLKWTNIIIIIVFHIIAVYGFITFPYWQKKVTFFYSCIVAHFVGFGVTGGAHRLWAHRAYKAKWPLRVFLLFCFYAAGQNSLFDWVRDHRVHHKYSETEADPHDSKRGFFFSHVGWLMMKKNPEVIRRGRQVDMSDILSDPVVKFGDKYFVLFKTLFCFVIPVLVPKYFWNEEWYYSSISQIARFVYTLNVTWSVNSFAHIWGSKPYDKNFSSGAVPSSMFMPWGPSLLYMPVLQDTNFDQDPNSQETDNEVKESDPLLDKREISSSGFLSSVIKIEPEYPEEKEYSIVTDVSRDSSSETPERNNQELDPLLDSSDNFATHRLIKTEPSTEKQIADDFSKEMKNSQSNDDQIKDRLRKELLKPQKKRAKRTTHFCTECKFTSKNVKNLDIHMQNEHNIIKQPNECPDCSATFKLKAMLRAHYIRKHTNEPLLHCFHCDKKYKLKTDLKNHLKVHHERREVVCKICKESFPNLNLMYTHKYRFHKKPFFKCKYCKRTLSNQASLDKHMVTQHSEDECKKCGKLYFSKEHFEVHVKRCIGVATCAVCRKEFFGETFLNQDSLGLSGKHLFVCNTCKKNLR